MSRRTINLNGCPWIGWDRLLSLRDKSQTERQRNSFVAIFETGCRVSETILLSPSMFELKDYGIAATRVPCIKRGSKKNGNVRVEPRDFIIPMDPLTKDFAGFIEERRDKAWLFPHTNPFSGEPDEKRHTSRVTIFRDIHAIDPSILFPHFLRHQRASQLATERKPDPYRLKDWFNWRSLDTCRVFEGHTERPSRMVRS